MVAWNVSAFLSARPPDTTRLATPKSGRSDLLSEVEIWFDGGSETSTGSRTSVSASASHGTAAGKAVDRTVKNLMGIEDGARTVEMAFPA